MACLRRTLQAARALPAIKDLTSYDASAAGLIACVGILGWWAAHGVSWSFDVWDSARDVGTAENILAGRYGGDSLYLDERQWYSPLVPFVIALLARTLSIDPMSVVVHGGIFLNLLAPFALYVFARSAIGRPEALVVLVAYLTIIPGRLPSVAAGSYSPWLIPYVFVPGCFLVALVALNNAFRQQRTFPYVLAGLAVTVVGFGHNAPLVVLLGACLCLVIMSAIAPRSSWSGLPRGAARGLTVTLAVAALALSVHFLPLLLAYSGRVANPEPAEWMPPLMSYREVGGYLSRAWGISTVVAGYGVIFALSKKFSDRRATAVLLITVGTVSALSFAYGYVAQFLLVRGLRLPVVAPGFHFAIYAKLCEALFFGIGFCAAVRMVSTRLRYTRGTVLGSGLLVIWSLAHVPSVLGRERELRASALRASRDVDLAEVVRWIRRNTRVDDVFLTSFDGRWSQEYPAVATAGRKMVAANAFFSNPFVSYEAREHDRQAMVRALKSSDYVTYHRLCRKYSVSYVLMWRQSTTESWPVEPTRSGAMSSVFENSHYVVSKSPCEGW